MQKNENEILYAIRNKHHKHLWWSHWWGWTEENVDRDLYTEEEHQLYSLPIEGEWILV
jgi:hypothetical protein